jgi:periplasmic protein TonB
VATTTVMLHVRAQPRRGPALRRARVPVACIVLSTLFHAALIGAFVAAADLWQSQQSKTYIINLVPAVAAVGTPEARRTAPTPTPMAPRPPEPAPPAPRTTTPPDLPARSEPTRAPELPAREARALPPRALPPRSAPREPALPPLSGKELPPIASSARTAPSPVPGAVAAPRREVATPQLGRANGSPQGSGPVTLEVDFPYAWYIQAVHRKISQHWDDQAHDGTQPVIVFEIGRNGQVGRVTVEKTSGNALYDQAAMRAVQNANPFPELPADFNAPLLRVHLSFGYAPRQG